MIGTSVKYYWPTFYWNTSIYVFASVNQLSVLNKQQWRLPHNICAIITASQVIVRLFYLLTGDKPTWIIYPIICFFEITLKIPNKDWSMVIYRTCNVILAHSNHLHHSTCTSLDLRNGTQWTKNVTLPIQIDVFCPFSIQGPWRISLRLSEENNDAK